jgi:hypothetical protein
MKKIISAALATLMAVSALTTTALAADVKGDSSISVKATTQLPKLKVTLPMTLSFVVNPYKMKLDAAGKVTTEDSGVSTQVVPIYGSTKVDGTDTPNTAWNIKNESGIGISCIMYAKVANGGDKTKFQIIDANNDNKDATDATTKSTEKRLLTLSLKGKAGTSEAKPIKFATTDVADWSTGDGKPTVKFDKIDDGASLAITLDTSASKCEVGSACTDTVWTAKDIATITMAFKFDFVANS